MNVNEFNITLAWSNGFDGFSPVTGVQIEIFEGDQLVDTRDLSGSSSLETTVVSSLSSFTDYTFVLRVRNAIGLSVPVSVSSSTLSLGEGRMICFVRVHVFYISVCSIMKSASCSLVLVASFEAT